QSPSTLDQLRAAGYRQAPVVITPNSSWSGYRPDLIAQIASQLEDENKNDKND
ncbi:NrdH-redoxin, partial [Bifidobacteriaceae bacterium GH022]